MAHLVIDLSGGFRCTLDGRILPPPPRRDIVRLLVYLALHAPASIPRSVLAADLWPLLPRPHSLANLRLILHTLQRHLASVGGDAVLLQVTPKAVGWDPTLRVTVDLRQVLEMAAAPPPGTDAEALPIPDGDLPDWSDPWFDDWRRRFDDARGHLLERQCAALEAAGQAAAARHAALSLLALRPVDETAHMRLIRLAANEGDLAGARRQFERYCLVLEDELGQKPSADALALARRLFDPRRIPSPGDKVPPAMPGNGVRPEGLSFMDPLGRVGQISALSRQHRLLVMTGPAGSGKSRLLRAVGDVQESPPAWVDLEGCTREAALVERFDQALATLPDRSTTLLLIDHAEIGGHLGLGSLLGDRLRAAPSLRVLAAGRSPLLISGERLWREPLLMDAGGVFEAGANAAKAEGIRFLRAASGWSEPGASSQWEALGTLVMLLENRPLFLLAAASFLAHATDPVVAADHLAAHPELLLPVPVSGARHATIADSLAADAAWLEPAASAVLPALARIPGDFGLTEACACGAASDEDVALDLLAHLARGGLLSLLPGQGVPRYRLPVLARAFWSRR